MAKCGGSGTVESVHTFCLQCWVDHCRARKIDPEEWKAKFGFCVCPH